MENNSTGFEVKYARTRQVAQYEPAVAEIRAVFNADSSDVNVAERKLNECREAVERVLGLKPTSVVVAKAIETVAQPEDISKRRGRPTKEEAAKKAATEALKRASTDDVMADLIGEDEQQNIQVSPEDRNDPMADLMDEKPAEPVKKITDQELQNAAGKANLRLGDPRVIKKWVQETFDVTKLGEIPAERRQEAVDGLANLKKDGTLG